MELGREIYVLGPAHLSFSIQKTESFSAAIYCPGSGLPLAMSFPWYQACCLAWESPQVLWKQSQHSSLAYTHVF